MIQRNLMTNKTRMNRIHIPSRFACRYTETTHTHTRAHTFKPHTHTHANPHTCIRFIRCVGFKLLQRVSAVSSDRCMCLSAVYENGGDCDWPCLSGIRFVSELYDGVSTHKHTHTHTTLNSFDPNENFICFYFKFVRCGWLQLATEIKSFHTHNYSQWNSLHVPILIQSDSAKLLCFLKFQIIRPTCVMDRWRALPVAVVHTTQL